jgi:hypothetical protein
VIEGGFQDRQHPVRSGAAAAHGLGAGVGGAVLWRGAGLAAQPRRRFGDLLMPADDVRFGQLRQLDRAQFRGDPCRSRPIEPIGCLATAPQIVGAIVGERVRDGIGAIERGEIAGLLACFATEPSARAPAPARSRTRSAHPDRAHRRRRRSPHSAGGHHRSGSGQPRCRPWRPCGSRARSPATARSNTARAGPPVLPAPSGYRSSGCEPCGPWRVLSVRSVWSRVERHQADRFPYGKDTERMFPDKGGTQWTHSFVISKR